jgi:hypothetical protein
MLFSHLRNHFLSTFFSAPLITPTATVYFISLTANLPKGGYSVKTSQHMALVGIKVMMAASLDFKCLGSSSITLPVLLSILVCNSANLQAM